MPPSDDKEIAQTPLGQLLWERPGQYRVGDAVCVRLYSRLCCAGLGPFFFLFFFFARLLSLRWHKGEGELHRSQQAVLDAQILKGCRKRMWLVKVIVPELSNLGN